MSINAPSASYSLAVRLEIDNKPGMLGKITSAIGKGGGDIGAIDVVSVGKSTITRDLSFKARDENHGQQVVDRLKTVGGVRVVNVSDRTFLMHLGGKIETHAKVGVKTRDDLAMVYTPGVARVCMAIHHDPEKAYTLTVAYPTLRTYVTSRRSQSPIADSDGPATANSSPVRNGCGQAATAYAGSSSLVRFDAP